MHTVHVATIVTWPLPQDMGTMVMGKVESGGLVKGSSLTLMPNKVHVCIILRSCFHSCIHVYFVVLCIYLYR